MNKRKLDYLERGNIAEEVIQWTSSGSDCESDNRKLRQPALKTSNVNKTRRARNVTKRRKRNSLIGIENLNITKIDSSIATARIEHNNFASTIPPRVSPIRFHDNQDSIVKSPVFYPSKSKNVSGIEEIASDKVPSSPILGKKIKVCREGSAKVRKKLRLIDEQQTSLVNKMVALATTSSDVDKHPNSNLINNIKTFFDTEIKSFSDSQVTIESVHTPEIAKSQSSNSYYIESGLSEPKSSSEVIRISSGTSSPNRVTKLSSSSSKEYFQITRSDTKDEAATNRKRKHKKGSLAYRLEKALRKRKTEVSIWKHEQYLSNNNRNFTLPTVERSCVFRIMDFKNEYGLHYIEGINVENERTTLVLLNSEFFNNFRFDLNSLLEVYEPYSVSDCLEIEYDVIYNVCKVRCLRVKDEAEESGTC